MRLLMGLGLLFALAFPLESRAQAMVPVDVGTDTIQFPADPGYLSVKASSPGLFKVLEAAIPTNIRLLDALYSDADLKLTIMGTPPKSTVFSMQVLRDVEALDFSEAEWQAGMPAIAKSMGGLDVQEIVNSSRKSANERMSDAAGVKIETRIGKVGKPEIYSAEGDSIRFLMVVPVQAKSAGNQVSYTTAAAGAIARVKGKMIYVYLFHNLDDEKTMPLLRNQLDEFLLRLFAANSATAPSAPAPAASTASATPNGALPEAAN